jgi:tetratricopeptide (TPR) repeat protein
VFKSNIERRLINIIVSERDNIVLGNLRLEKSRYEEAIKQYEQAIRLKPDSWKAWNYRGVALLQLGRYEESIASFDKALEIKPDYQAAKTNRDTAFKQLNREPE